jgi:hypothetical protein
VTDQGDQSWVTLGVALPALTLTGHLAFSLTRSTKLGDQASLSYSANEPAIWRIILRDGSLLSVKSSPDAVSTRTPRLIRAMTFEMVCLALKTGDCDDYVKQAIATKLITLAKAGERDPDRLCEEVVKDIRTPQQWAASEAAKSSILSDDSA